MLRFKPIALLVLLSCCHFLFACSPYLSGAKIELNSYYPTLTGDFSDYRDKKIYLMNFDNRANNTSVWYYYSADMKFTYGGDSYIYNYFWHAFQKALVNLEMEVSRWDRPHPLAPGMRVILKSLTEDRFQVEVILQAHDDPLFFKIFTISEEPLKGNDRTPENLEYRAYKMTSRLIETILNDPQFKRAFIKATAKMAVKK